MKQAKSFLVFFSGLWLFQGKLSALNVQGEKIRTEFVSCSSCKLNLQAVLYKP